jgi:hypothetical protein
MVNGQSEKLEDHLSELKLTIGGEEVSLRAATAPNTDGLEFTFPSVKYGEYEIFLTHPEHGHAMFNETQQLIRMNNELDFTTSTPAIGSQEGTILTLAVNGVPMIADDDVLIKLQKGSSSYECAIMTQTYSQITCRTPKITESGKFTIKTIVGDDETTLTCRHPPHCFVEFEQIPFEVQDVTTERAQNGDFVVTLYGDLEAPCVNNAQGQCDPSIPTQDLS